MNRITPEEVREQLAEIIASKDFIASDRLRNFLTYTVEETLKGKGDQLKAFNIAVDVFHLGEGFDAAGNPLIRNEAARLRSKLEHYYLLNPAASVYISIPKGGYQVEFGRRGAASGQNGESFCAPALSGAASLALPQHKAAIAVERFNNINKKEDAEVFSSALFNDLALELTRENDLKVVHARSGNEARREQGGGEFFSALNPRFILRGSVILEKKRLKVWVFLTDASTGANVWADKFETQFASERQKDWLGFQEHVAGCILGRLCGDSGVIQQVLLNEYSSGANDFSPVQAATVVYSKWADSFTRQTAEEAHAALNRALEHEPRQTQLRAMLADLYVCSHQFSYELVEQPLEKALVLAAEAIYVDPACQLAHLALAGAHALRNDKAKFSESARRVLEINPLSSSNVAALAPYYVILGLPDEAVELCEKILTLNLPRSGECHIALSLCHYFRGDYRAALDQARKIARPGALCDGLLRLCAGGMLGDCREAEAAADELLEAYPDFSKQGLRILSCAFPRVEDLEAIREGLARGGLRIS